MQKERNMSAERMVIKAKAETAEARENVAIFRKQCVALRYTYSLSLFLSLRLILPANASGQ